MIQNTGCNDSLNSFAIHDIRLEQHVLYLHPLVHSHRVRVWTDQGRDCLRPTRAFTFTLDRQGSDI